MKFSRILLASTMLCALSAPVAAAEISNGNTYAKLSAGAIIPEDIDGSVGATNVKLKFDTGWTVTGALGYWVSDSVALEGELGYLSADFKNATALGVTVPVDGDVTSAFAFANANYHFAGKSAGFDPYIGAGVGIARSKVTINSINGTPVNGSDSSTDGALQASAGFNLAVGSGTTIGAQYRYLYLDTGEDGTDSFTGHNITANVTFAF